MHRIVLYFLWLGIISLPACAKDEPSKLSVLSSIKPVQAIVFAIAGEQVESHQLIPDSASPHHYAFKPSDMRKIAAADLIFRVDEHFEAMLNPVLDDLTDQSRVISFADNPALQLLPLVGKHSHDVHEDHQAVDMHIFTSPKNAIVMAQIVVDALSKLDPNNKQIYQNNAQILIDKILQTSNKLKLELSPFNNKSYVVFHNSWQYFAKDFGLQSPKIVSPQEGVIAGGKTIKKIRDEIESKRIKCVFKEPNISPSRVDTLIENMPDFTIKSVEIDVLGRHLPMGKDNYIQWLEHMGSQIKSCLSD